LKCIFHLREYDCRAQMRKPTPDCSRRSMAYHGWFEAGGMVHEGR
jgi:hypothetical protein